VIRLLALLLAAQAPAIPKVVVSVQVPDVVQVAAGQSGEARIVATIANGFKIQANPASDRFLIPARLRFEPDDRVRVGDPEYPAGKPYRLQGAKTDMSVYEKSVEIRVPLEAIGSGKGAAASSLETTLQGSLRFQACNAVVCLKPASVPVMVRVRIEPGVTTPPR